MITKFKIFENINKMEEDYRLSVGDYILLKNNVVKELTKFQNILGEIIKISYYTNKEIECYIVRFIVNNNSFEEDIFDDEIEYWSKNKEELEQMILVNKYNL